MSENSLVCNKNTLVVVAHPDDAEAFFSGTIEKIVQRGNRVTMVVDDD
jgi:LmbE family N-acetylglucosaminyl deacetylase